MARTVEQIEAELEVAKLEAALVEAKEGDGATPELKQELREARRAYREQRQATGVTPATIAVNAETNEAGN